MVQCQKCLLIIYIINLKIFDSIKYKKTQQNLNVFDSLHFKIVFSVLQQRHYPILSSIVFSTGQLEFFHIQKSWPEGIYHISYTTKQDFSVKASDFIES